MTQKNVVLFFVVAAASFTLTFPALSQETGYGLVTSLQTGSLGGAPGPSVLPGRVEGDDTLSVTLDVPFVNSGESNTTPAVHIATPTPCKVTTGGYALDPKDTGVKLNESVLLSAYLAGKRVSLTLSGCVFGKPRIVSVKMSFSNK